MVRSHRFRRISVHLCISHGRLHLRGRPSYTRKRSDFSDIYSISVTIARRNTADLSVFPPGVSSKVREFFFFLGGGGGGANSEDITVLKYVVSTSNSILIVSTGIRTHHPRSHRTKATLEFFSSPPSFCGACLKLLSRGGFNRPFLSLVNREVYRVLCTHDIIVLHLLGMM